MKKNSDTDRAARHFRENEERVGRDITSRYLEAAILDQKVAGAFQGKAYVFVATFHEGKCILGVAVANEQGYSPIEGKTFAHWPEARQWARELNEHIGRTEEEVLDIVVSTMGGARVVVT